MQATNQYDAGEPGVEPRSNSKQGGLDYIKPILIVLAAYYLIGSFLYLIELYTLQGINETQTIPQLSNIFSVFPITFMETVFGVLFAGSWYMALIGFFAFANYVITTIILNRRLPASRLRLFVAIVIVWLVFPIISHTTIIPAQRNYFTKQYNEALNTQIKIVSEEVLVGTPNELGLANRESPDSKRAFLAINLQLESAVEATEISLPCTLYMPYSPRGKDAYVPINSQKVDAGHKIDIGQNNFKLVFGLSNNSDSDDFSIMKNSKDYAGTYYVECSLDSLKGTTLIPKAKGYNTAVTSPTTGMLGNGKIGPNPQLNNGYYRNTILYQTRPYKLSDFIPPLSEAALLTKKTMNENRAYLEKLIPSSVLNYYPGYVFKVGESECGYTAPGSVCSSSNANFSPPRESNSSPNKLYGYYFSIYTESDINSILKSRTDPEDISVKSITGKIYYDKTDKRSINIIWKDGDFYISLSSSLASTPINDLATISDRDEAIKLLFRRIAESN